MATQLLPSDRARGWICLQLDVEHQDDLIPVATTVLSWLGQPFRILDAADGLWNELGVNQKKAPGDFSGVGRNRLHVDAPNVESAPEYLALLCVRKDPAGGGATLLSDLRAGVAGSSSSDRGVLSQPVFYEGRVFGLSGVGRERQPFPVLDADNGFVRFAAKMVDDPRNRAHRETLARFESVLDRNALALMMQPGQLMIVNQRLIAHGREPLGDQMLVPALARLLWQTKVAVDPAAPVVAAGHS